MVVNSRQLSRHWHSRRRTNYWPADTNPYAQPDTAIYPMFTGPKSAHVAWKQPFNIGGLVGGSMGQQTIWESARVIYGHPTIIYSGRAYWTTTKVVDGANTKRLAMLRHQNRRSLLGKIPSTQPPTFIIYDAR